MSAVARITISSLFPTTHSPEETRPEAYPYLGATLLPLPVAVRLDMDLRTGARGSVPVSTLLWVSPSTDRRRVKSLGSVVIPN